MKLKKLTAFIVCFLFLLNILELPSFNVKAAGTPKITYSVSGSVAVGQDFYINVNAENVADLFGADLTLKYDNTMIQIYNDQVKVGDVFANMVQGDDYSFGVQDATADGLATFSLLLGDKHKTGINIDATPKSLFVIKAKALKAGNLALNFVAGDPVVETEKVNSRVKLADSGEGVINFTIEQKSISIFNAPIEPVQIKSFIADKVSPQVLGTATTFTATATGGTSLLYQFWVYDGAKWTMVQNYSTKNTFIFNPSAIGNYTVAVYVKDVNSTKALDVSTSVKFSVINTPDPVQLKSFIADKVSPQVLGTATTFTATATGGTSLLYQFWVYDGAKWTMVQNYSTKNTFIFNPSAIGNYTVAVYVKDINSTKALDVSTSMKFSVIN
ncbi:hypothetical protein NBE98_03320 [Clostridium swellfunianum]|uniref:triple tyrosine motif-containing protein n=1 Tax=Clostridium swellfunianum TaxID=1367462 RepID=UPI0020302BCC|nr:triple tyrosine motif-containing protein [Clostridium swellfunianum]MCM0647406.1 hypothetical protein [Clostridium swellfunianum]